MGGRDALPRTWHMSGLPDFPRRPSSSVGRPLLHLSYASTAASDHAKSIKAARPPQIALQAARRSLPPSSFSHSGLHLMRILVCTLKSNPATQAVTKYAFSVEGCRPPWDRGHTYHPAPKQWRVIKILLVGRAHGTVIPMIASTAAILNRFLALGDSLPLRLIMKLLLLDCVWLSFPDRNLIDFNSGFKGGD